MKYINRDNITLFLSILGSAGTILSWLFAWVKSRKNISFRIIKICKSDKMVIMYASLINRSGSPITIDKISLSHNNVQYTCNEIPKKILSSKTTSGGVVTSEKEIYSLQLPLSLSSLAGISGYFAFQTQKEALSTLSTPLTFLISTNRGKAIEKKLDIENWDNWADMF